MVPIPELQLNFLETELIPDLQLKEMKLRDAHLPMLPTGGGRFGVRHVAPLDPGLMHALVRLEVRVRVVSGGPMWPRHQRLCSLVREGARTVFLRCEKCVSDVSLPLSSCSALRLSGGIQPAGVPVVYVPRSRLVRGPAGHPGCYPGLRRGHVLLHGRSRPSSVDSSGKLRRRCLGDLCGELCGGP